MQSKRAQSKRAGRLGFPSPKEESSVGQKVKTFHRATGIKPGPINDANILNFRLDLLLEEMMEVVEAAGFRHDEEKGLRRKYTVKPEELLKELCDVVYVAIGWANTHGWDFDEAFRRVHASNMTKITPEGKVLKRKNGKVMKPDSYIAPDLKDLVGGK